jgi:hypothetical protein
VSATLISGRKYLLAIFSFSATAGAAHMAFLCCCTVPHGFHTIVPEPTSEYVFKCIHLMYDALLAGSMCRIRSFRCRVLLSILL